MEIYKLEMILCVQEGYIFFFFFRNDSDRSFGFIALQIEKSVLCLT